MKCFGRDALTGAAVEVEFGENIVAVRPAHADDDVYLAPGWIDLQVNGFAGVDYNRPGCPQEEIARSLDALFATGVTRLFPTVITGPPEDMSGALRNLSRARESLAHGGAMEAFHVE